MLVVLSGNHTFLRQQALVELKQQIKLEPQIVSTDDLSPAELSDLLLAQSLFEPKRFVLLYGLAENAAAWQRLTELAEVVAKDDSLVLVLVEEKLDNRTRFVKQARQAGWLKEFHLETDASGRVRDYGGRKSVQFVLEQAQKLDLKIDRSLAQRIYQHVGPDPWELYNALERLDTVGEISTEALQKYVPQNPMVNLFEILQKAFRGEMEAVAQEIDELESSDTEPMQFFGLLTSQVVNLLGLVAAPPDVDVAGDLRVNRFALDQLRPIAQQQSLGKMKRVVELFVQTDQRLKTGAPDTWLEIKLLLAKITQL